MFKYLALTSETCSWLLGRQGILDALSLLLLGDDLPALRGKAFSERGFNIAGDPHGQLLAVWHDQYLTGTGDETWGVIRFDQSYGLHQMPSIAREVFKREVTVVSQRLQGLLIDQQWFLRKRDTGVFTLAAGGGEEAHKSNIAYYESDVLLTNSNRTRAIILVGPAHSFESLTRLAREEGAKLAALVDLANRLPYRLSSLPAPDSAAFDDLRNELKPSENPVEGSLADVNTPLDETYGGEGYKTTSFSYDDWLSSARLTEQQKKVVDSDIITRYPLRIVGPAGSGKTLLMQLLAISRLRAAAQNGTLLRLLYVTHNSAMAESVIARFEVLGAEQYLYGGAAGSDLHVETLAGYARRELGLAQKAIIDVDAHRTKLYQLERIQVALAETLLTHSGLVKSSKLLSAVSESPTLSEIFSRLLMTEISVAIKGHLLINDERRYVEGEQRLSRLHGSLSEDERRFVFAVFKAYHSRVFEQEGVLDSDDLAISLYGYLRTPIWELRRRDLGFDHVFVDETQLFNENERRIFPLLTRGGSTHIPIVVALDEAQEVFGQMTAGFGALGIPDLQDEALDVSQRSTKAILDLSFFLVERTKHLLETRFPQFPASAVPNDHPLAKFPCVERYKGGLNFHKFVLRRIRELRKENVWQIAVVCHAEIYWEGLNQELSASDLPLYVLLQRGDRVSADRPVVVLTRPAYVGGQEFDAVIAVGLEEGLVPPRITDNDGLDFAVEQQALREMYVSFTRARYRLLVALPQNVRPSGVLQEAIGNGLLIDPDGAPRLPFAEP
jgi:hypothetical protein